MKALVTGATGLVGTALMRHLDDAVVLRRSAYATAQARHDGNVFQWDPIAGPPPSEAFRGVDVVFHLAGEPVGSGRWSAQKKRRISNSRILGTRHLVRGLAALDPRPKVLVSASAIGYYGDCGDRICDETSPPGAGFLADVCTGWEREAMAATHLGMRVVCVRFGIILAKEGGALARMLPLFRAGLGGRLGRGSQWMSWIHLDDAVGLLLAAGQRHDLSGAMNAVSPHPLTNCDFTRTLAHAVHRPALMPVPKIALQMALGEASTMVLASQRVVPRVAVGHGYVFKYSALDMALKALLEREP